VALPALAQDNFPDVPANHWAYEALARLKKDGLLVGYPDGLYRGSRPASRYELAVAIHAAYTNLRNLTDGLDAQIKAMTTINPQDIQNLKDQVAALQNEVNAMKGWGDDIAALKKAADQFDRELRSLGVDVEAMKKDLGDLADRVTRLEKRKPAVDISGDVNFFAVSTNSNGNPGITQDGRLEGLAGGVKVGLGHDLAVFHEGAFTFAGTNDTGPKWKVTAVVGNMMGNNALGNQSSLVTGGGLAAFNDGVYDYAATNEDVYIQDASVKFDTSVIGLAFNVEAGRVAYSSSDYVFKRAINQSYYENSRWDDGLYRFDGAILGFNFGGVKLNVFGGNNSNLSSVNGVDLNPVIIANNRFAGGPSESIFGTYGTSVNAGTGIIGQMDKTLGATAGFPLLRNGHVDLQYLLFEQEGTNAGGDNLLGNGIGNRDSVYGGDAEFGFGRIKLSGGFHKSELTDNTTAVNSHDDTAWNAKVSFHPGGRWGLWGGYREVDTDYFAPGDWGRLGPIVNPSNIVGWQAGGHFDLTHALRLSANGEWDKGHNNESGVGLMSSPFTTSTTINKYETRLDLRVNPNLSLYGSWQDTKFSNLLGGGGDVFFDWASIGLGYGLGANTKFNLAYEFSNAGGGIDGFNRLTGGILTSQLTVKF